MNKRGRIQNSVGVIFGLGAVGIVAGALMGLPRCEAQGFGSQNPGGANSLPGITWSVDQIEKAVAPARAGKVLLPKAWPNGARVAVVVSFDVDNESPLLARGRTQAGPLSDTEYGATEAVPRILATLNRLDIPSTWFMPAVSAMLAPQMLPMILKSGKNEVALHGYIHEPVVTLNNGAEEERLLRQASDYLAKETGKKPVGSRTGAWAISSYTIGVDQKVGLLYDSSMMAMDVPYEIMSNGQDTGLVELPVTWVLDDAPYFGSSGALPSPQLIYKVYQDEFDMAYREGTFIMLTFHPHISGRRSREIYLEGLLSYIKSKPGVWFATAEQVANYVKANADPQATPIGGR